MPVVPLGVRLRRRRYPVRLAGGMTGLCYPDATLTRSPMAFVRAPRARNRYRLKRQRRG